MPVTEQDMLELSGGRPRKGQWDWHMYAESGIPVVGSSV